MTSQMRYNTKEQIFITQLYIYLLEEHHVTYYEFNELMEISPSQFSVYLKTFKQMIKDLRLRCELLEETNKSYEYENQFGVKTYYLQSISNDYYFEYEHLNEEQLIKYSLTIVYLFLRNSQYVTTNLLQSIFPNFTRKTSSNLFQKLREIIPGELEKNQLLSYVIDLD